MVVVVVPLPLQFNGPSSGFQGLSIWCSTSSFVAPLKEGVEGYVIAIMRCLNGQLEGSEDISNNQCVMSGNIGEVNTNI